MVYEAAGTHQEAEQAAVAMDFLDSVKQTADHIVSAGSLTTRKNYTHIDRLAGSGSGILFKTDFGKTVSIGEQTFDSSLVSNGLCRATFHYFNSTC